MDHRPPACAREAGLQAHPPGPWPWRRTYIRHGVVIAACGHGGATTALWRDRAMGTVPGSGLRTAAWRWADRRRGQGRRERPCRRAGAGIAYDGTRSPARGGFSAMRPSGRYPNSSDGAWCRPADGRSRRRNAPRYGADVRQCARPRREWPPRHRRESSGGQRALPRRGSLTLSRVGTVCPALRHRDASAIRRRPDCTQAEIERVCRGMRGRVQAGHPLLVFGIVPYGYRYVGGRHFGRLEPDPVRLRSSGTSSRGTPPSASPPTPSPSA